MASLTQRLRLCDPIKKKLPLIKNQLRKKIPIPWTDLTEKELKRIRRPFDAYSNELLEDGYPESSEYLRRVISIKERKTSGEMSTDSVLIENPTLLDHTMQCLKNLEDCERVGSSTADAFDDLIRLSLKMADVSKQVAKELFQIILNKITITSDELLKNYVRFLYGKLLADLNEYDNANIVLKEALDESEKNNFKDLELNICKAYHDLLYSMSRQSMATNEKLAIQFQLVNHSIEMAQRKNNVTKMSVVNDSNATINSLIQRGNIFFSNENYAEAIADFQSASVKLTGRFNLELKLEVLYKLTSCYFITKNYNSCIRLLGSLGRLAAVYKAPVYEAHFYRIDAEMNILAGKSTNALRNLLKCIKIYDEFKLHQLSKRCRFLGAIVECEYLVDPWIDIIIDFEKDKDIASSYELSKAHVLLFNWKLRREYFCERIIN